ncbi:MAG: NepR family anti-sigma factor [Pseudomonadota bacterium]
MVERPAKDRGKQPKTDAPAPGSSASSPADVGAALRKAFQSAVEEDVPDELLDLLRRLD